MLLRGGNGMAEVEHPIEGILKKLRNIGKRSENDGYAV